MEKSERLEIRCSPVWRQRLQTMAEAAGVTEAELVRQAVEDMVCKRSKALKKPSGLGQGT